MGIPLDTLHSQAIEGLTQAAEALLGGLPAPGPALTLRVYPLRVAPAGIGGYVGEERNPAGSLYARRVDASLRLTVQASDNGTLGARVGSVLQAFLGTSRADLRRRGILSLRPGEITEPAALPEGAGLEQTVSFAVLYEFVGRPDEAEIPIREIVRDVDLHPGPGTAVRMALPFRAGVLDRFERVDDPAAGTDAPSAWSFNAAESRLEQRSRIRGGADAGGPDLPGTYLVLRPNPGSPVPPELSLRATLQSGRGGVGLLFRWQDVDNFYFCLFHQEAGRSFRLLGKKVGGVFQALDTPARDNERGYAPGAVFAVRVAAAGNRLRVLLDGQEVLSGRDASFAGPGRVGLMCRDADQANFYRLDWD